MSQIVPNLELTYQEGTNPKHYNLIVKIDAQAASPNLMVTHNGSMTTPNLLYTVTVEMDENTQGDTELSIDLGQLSIDPENGDIEVQLVDKNNNGIGGNIVRTKDAEKSSR